MILIRSCRQPKGLIIRAWRVQNQRSDTKRGDAMLIKVRGRHLNTPLSAKGCWTHWGWMKSCLALWFPFMTIRNISLLHRDIDFFADRGTLAILFRVWLEVAHFGERGFSGSFSHAWVRITHFKRPIGLQKCLRKLLSSVEMGFWV